MLPASIYIYTLIHLEVTGDGKQQQNNAVDTRSKFFPTLTPKEDEMTIRKGYPVSVPFKILTGQNLR